MELAVSYHNCTKTDFIVKQVVRPEFIEVKFKEIKPLLNLMSNVASNLNQIARTLNILKREDVSKLTDEQFDVIQENYRTIKELFGDHDIAMQKVLLDYYKISKKKKIRPIGDVSPEEFNEITNEKDE
ncbi:MAG: hypothetical protein EOM11_04895 [Erysipelotrichia bacterium]|nr:hypothetical protein [Erysipelotrichia bacterium]